VIPAYLLAGYFFAANLCPSFLQFLLGVSITCYAEPCISYGRVVRPFICPSVCPSMRLSQAGTVLKRRKLRSRNLHRQIAQGL